MSPPRRAPFVALASLMRSRDPDIEDPERLIRDGLVLVNGAPCANPHARVRADCTLRVLRPRQLRGTLKLARAIETAGVDVGGLITLDIGAAAGGFTQALLDAGADTVYAVDTGVGQLRGLLRADRRVVNLERTNLADLDAGLIPLPVQLVVVDLSYLAIADALPQLSRVPLAVGARLLALVKPTFELHSGYLGRQR
ncbi:MAG: SAM-dependent methyltransferase [Acidimicrobiales bacterium]